MSKEQQVVVARAVAALALLVTFGAVVAIVLSSDLDGSPAGAPEGNQAEPDAEPEQGGWESLTASPLERIEVGAVRIGPSIYVVGGLLETGEATAEVARYDVPADEWELVASLPIAVHQAAVAELDGQLYVLGGVWPEAGEGVRSPRLYRYDPETDLWEQLPDAPTARSAHALAAFEGELYAVGGATQDDSELTTLEIYSPQDGTWRTGPPMPTGRSHVAAAVAGDRLHVIGGRSGPADGNLRTVESFDAEEEWREEPSLEVARSGHAAAAVDDRIVTFGGEELGEDGETIAAVELLEPGADSWLSLPELEVPRHGLGGAARGSSVFALEGGTQPGLQVTGALEVIELR